MNLLLKGRRCLFVGAGHVAHRKCRRLLEHGAQVTLVAPDLGPGIRALRDSGAVEVREGRYDASLLDEVRPFLVYAATDDDALNRRIAADAAAREILCSSVSSWREGDFISPSLIPWGKGQVSVSTEGASCRQAKFMRMRLENLLGGERDLLLVGVDCRSLSLREFERIRPDAARAAELRLMLVHLAALEEFALLATCNRLELYAFARPEESLLSTVRRILGLEGLEDRVAVRTGRAVLEHAANVVAGHFSEVVGETQVTGQFKEAFAESFRLNAAGVHLQNLHDEALKLGRKLRTMGGAGEGGLPELVADVLRRRGCDGGARVLVLGAGGLGREVAGRLAALPVTLTWANRTPENIPPEPPGRRLPLPRALASLGEHDVVVSILGAAEPVVLPEHLPGEGPAPLFIDLGLPRNVHPEVAGREDVTVLDLGHFRRPGVDREALVTLAHALAGEEAARG